MEFPKLPTVAGKEYRQLTGEECQVVFSCVRLPDEALRGLIASHMGARIAKGRSSWLRYPAENGVIALIGLLAVSPGNVVLYLHALNQFEPTGACNHYCVSDFVNNVIPFGLPTNKALEAVWDAQKIQDPELHRNYRTDNWLDVQDVWLQPVQL